MTEKIYKENGHWYINTTSENLRRCRNCDKLQIKYQGVWIDKPKESVQRKPKKVEESQISMFDVLTDVKENAIIEG